ncbi:DUF4097 family beta strand repeat-containing protein, partial [Pseudomonas sp. 2995-1]|uniref:DUF4097 family beta strand repeat-containing protein n=1 Tax=Pseudomonas sp. 2995-1 TaxID=1712679 RepID=UPI00117A5B18
HISDNIENLVVATDNARINLRPTNDSEVTVEFNGNTSDYELSTDVNGQTLHVDLLRKNKWKFINLDLFPRTQTLTVMIPEKMYESIQVESKNGRIDISGVQSETLEVNTN